MALKDIRPALREFLLGGAEISAAVGSARVYPGSLPQGQTADSIVYNQISEDTDKTMDGPSGLVSSRFQIDAWSTTIDAAHSLALLVKERLNGYRGPMGSGGALVQVQGAFADNARFDYDATAKLHRASRDFFINYEER